MNDNKSEFRKWPEYYKIGEVASQYHVSSDALRYYEDMELIKPQRSDSGYRLYTDHDIWRLNVIINLRNLDFSIERIRSYLNEGTIDSTMKLLEEEQRAVDLRLDKLEKIKERIIENINVINTAKTLVMDKIEIKHYEDRRVMRVDADFSKDEEMDQLMRYLADSSEKGIDIIGNRHIAAILAPMDQDDHIYSGAVMLSINGNHTLPAGDYLSVCYSGKWNSRAYARKLIDYASESGIELDDFFLDIIWIDVHTAIRVSDHISEIQARIIKRK